MKSTSESNQDKKQETNALEKAGERHRRTDEEIEKIRGQIFELRARGLSITAVAKVTGLTRSNVQYHIRQMKKEKFDTTIADASDQTMIGDILLKMDRLEQMALQNYSLTDEKASAARLHWLECAARRQGEKIQFLSKLGLITNIATEDKTKKKRLKKMSTEEIQQRIGEISGMLRKEQESSIELIDENKRLKKILKDAGVTIEPTDKK